MSWLCIHIISSLLYVWPTLQKEQYGRPIVKTVPNQSPVWSTLAKNSLLKNYL